MFQTNSPHFYTSSVNAVGSKLECAFVKFSQVWCKKYAFAHENDTGHMADILHITF